MEKRYVNGNRIHSLLEKLVSEGKAKVVIESLRSDIEIYSLNQPEVAVVARLFVIEGKSNYVCYVVGREEDVQKAEETYGLQKIAEEELMERGRKGLPQVFY